MNKQVSTIFALAFLLLSAAAAVAQPPAPPDRKDGPPPPPPPYELGKVLPPFVRDGIDLTKEQADEIAKLEAEVKQRLEKILTAEQKNKIKDLRPRGPGGPGGPPPGGPGGPGGPPRGGPGGPPGDGPGKPPPPPEK